MKNIFTDKPFEGFAVQNRGRLVAWIRNELDATYSNSDSLSELSV